MKEYIICKDDIVLIITPYIADTNSTTYTETQSIKVESFMLIIDKDFIRGLRLLKFTISSVPKNNMDNLLRGYFNSESIVKRDYILIKKLIVDGNVIYDGDD